MKSRIRLAGLLVSVFVTGFSPAQQQAPLSAQGEPSTPEAIKQLNDEKVAEVSKQIAGREDKPSEAVFKNIKILNGIPAGHLLGIMQIGFSRSLGVSCTHCHIPDQWEKDAKPAKQITRDMWAMSRAINNDLLRNIAGIRERNPIVNCTTCHRGQLKPALNMDTSDTPRASSHQGLLSAQPILETAKPKVAFVPVRHDGCVRTVRGFWPSSDSKRREDLDGTEPLRQFVSRNRKSAPREPSTR